MSISCSHGNVPERAATHSSIFIAVKEVLKNIKTVFSKCSFVFIFYVLDCNKKKNSFSFKVLFHLLQRKNPSFANCQLKSYNFHIIRCVINWMLINFRFKNHDNVKKQQSETDVLRAGNELGDELKAFCWRFLLNNCGHTKIIALTITALHYYQ